MLKKTINVLLLYLLLFIVLFLIYFPLIHLNLLDFDFLKDDLFIEISIKLIELFLIGILFWALNEKLIFTNKNISRKQIAWSIVIFIALFVFNDFLLSTASANSLLIKQIIDGRPLLFDFRNFIIFVILAPIIEELLYRKLMVSYLLPSTVEDIKGVLFYTFFISILFASAHYDHYEWYNLTGYFIFSIVVTLLYYKNRNIIMTIFFHMFFNFIPTIYGQS